MFYRMPPASLSRTGSHFLPDYAALLLADRIVLDSFTYELLISRPPRPYGRVADAIRILHGEGFVRLENFDGILAQHLHFLDSLVERDLNEVESWIPILHESLSEWRRFVAHFQGPLRNTVEQLAAGAPTSEHFENSPDALAHRASFEVELSLSQILHVFGNAVAGATLHMQALSSPHGRSALRSLLRKYLEYVNANLLLSREIGAAFHDWSDFRPFYRDKFRRVARQSAPAEAEIEATRQLFTVSFPELALWSPRQLVKALRDKRIGELRGLVEAASRREIIFDREFALRVTREVLGVERSIARIRNYVSYVTLPIEFIPVIGTPLQKVAEEAISQPLARRLREPYSWFYMISELTGTSSF